MWIVDCYSEKFLLVDIANNVHLIIGCMFNYDLYWGRELVRGTSVTLELAEMIGVKGVDRWGLRGLKPPPPKNSDKTNYSVVWERQK